MKSQTGTALTADFLENTWTFEMTEGFQVKSGNFVIISEELFQEYQVNIRELIKSFQSKLNAKNATAKDIDIIEKINNNLNLLY